MASRARRSTMLRAPRWVLPPRACKNKGLSKPSPPVCHFLRLPPEIRCMIYRCLFEPEDSRTLTPKQVYPGIELESTRTPLPTEILRSNRQIYSEASSLMYSELIVVLTPGDIVCLRSNLEDTSAPNRGVWRHNPLAGTGVLGPHNGRIYNTPEMDGKMEPHVFSRFKHISLELEFNCNPEDLAGCPQLSIDPDLKIASEDCVKFQDFLRQTNIFRDLAEIICNSPRVTCLEILLEVSVDPADDINLTYPYTADDNLPDVYFMTVHTRAVEIFIESGIMDPLRSLSNVDLTCIWVVQPWTGNDQKLQPKYDAMLRELEED
ncbi:uncharacterized protein K444DRAFT_223792 [Hyaloscypha bicolor E]|uniref:F-box domain-containing protein n=1 Tax=Hyaloscypha bicolor E TaxID=1095630 RepID=A0A2J6SJU1_9HELO|nr:uncharacterized protein K444DRAFT_223792 [Hyaloscypha bicolor E]PMD51039.1 hypothetical protein K444DRAFT_223792 [Hyaloscypha bicolor E]